MNERGIEKITRLDLKQMTVDEMDKSFEDLVWQIQEENPDIWGYRLYKLIAERLPGKAPIEAQERCLDVERDGLGLFEKSRKALLYMHMKSVLSGVDLFLGRSREDDNEITQSAIVAVMDALQVPNRNLPLAQQVHISAVEGAANYLSTVDNMPSSWIRDVTRYKALSEFIESQESMWDGMEWNDEAKAKDLRAKIEISPNPLNDYLAYKYLIRNAEEADSELVVDEDFNLEDEVMREFLVKELQSILLSIDPKERQVLKLGFGLGGGKRHSQEEIGSMMGMIRSQVHKLQQKALRRLRHPSRSRRLLGTIDDSDRDKIKPEPQIVYDMGLDLDAIRV